MTVSREDVVTIVSGLPRSGTSLMMQMIDKGGIPALVDHVRKADEDNPKGYYEFEPVKQTRKDASWLKDASGKVVKMVHMLLLDLPADYTYRVVFMRRHLQEVIASQNHMLVRRGKPVDELPTDKLIAMFQAQLDKVDRHLQAHRNFRVLRVNYNEILQDPAPAVAAVNAFLGGEMDTEAMLAVVDPSLYRNRR